MKQYGFKHHIVFFDEDTGDFKIEERECFHHLEFAKLTCEDGRIQVRKQCFKCFKLWPAAISQSGIDIDRLKDVIKYEDSEKTKERLDLDNRLVEKKKALMRANRFIEMVAYYESKEWRVKANKVLQRDKHTCQACLSEKATQVHHLNYDHFKNEPLFDLVAVCKPCHDKVTQIDRANK